MWVKLERMLAQEIPPERTVTSDKTIGRPARELLRGGRFSAMLWWSMGFAVRLASLGLAALFLAGAPAAFAQGKQKPAPRAAKAKKAPEKADAQKGKKEAEQAEAEGETKETKEEKPDAPAGAPEGAVKAAGTKETKESEKDKKDARVTGVEESAKDKGVKTYKFSAVEVEGRLKSPQIVYFLRRVRAEFEAGALGHRSFMPELSDTRRSPALK